MNKFLLSQISKLSDTHFVGFGGIKVVLVNGLEVFNEDLKSVFLLDFIISTVELNFEILEL